MLDTFGADPELRNFVEFSELTPDEMQENSFKRINVLIKKHPHLLKPNYLSPPYTDWQRYF